MPTTMLETASELTSRWRTSPDGDNPAGPLYAAGAFAEADITSPDMALSAVCSTICTPGCSDCTASRTVQCC